MKTRSSVNAADAMVLAINPIRCAHVSAWPDALARKDTSVTTTAESAFRGKLARTTKFHRPSNAVNSKCSVNAVAPAHQLAVALIRHIAPFDAFLVASVKMDT
jgi:hypothetical protein